MTSPTTSSAGALHIRKAEERGRADFGWLDSRHSFSFGHYHDPRHMGFRSLRVINDDRVAAARGFDAHPHHDMEIISYVVQGALEHQDSMGTGSVIRPGDIQRMSAGTGVTHSEYNPSRTEGVHFLQIWILPERRGLPPGYEQRRFDRDEKLNQLRLVGSRDGRDGSLTIHQDVELYASILEAGQAIRRPLEPRRHVWVQVIAGTVRVNGAELRTGDGAALSEAGALELQAGTETELLVFDLA